MLQSTNFERLQQLVTQRDGEIVSLQAEVSTIDAARKALEEDLVRLSNRNDELYVDTRANQLAYSACLSSNTHSLTHSHTHTLSLCVRM
jgi:hypothetical protein